MYKVNLKIQIGHLEVKMKNKKNTIIMLLLLLIIVNSSLVYGELAEEKLNLSGESYILIDGDTGRVLMEENAHKKMPMASTTKIMTALVALEKGNLNDRIRIDDDSVGVEGSSIYLKKGEIITLKDLIYGLMLRSGNDAAVAIGIHIGGTTEEFVNLMNSKAKSIGALNTSFANPNGLNDENHYSTAYDMALITKEAFKHDVFAEIVNSKSYTSNRNENNYFYNKNKTLWEYEGGSGVKTGYTMASGRCLVSSASRNGLNLISVSLNARDWFNDNYKLFDYGFERYKSYLIFDKGQFMKKIKVSKANREYVNLIAENTLFYPLKEGEKDNIKIDIQSLEDIELPISKGDVLGSVSVYLDGKLISRENLISKDTIDKESFINRLLNRNRYN